MRQRTQKRRLDPVTLLADVLQAAHIEAIIECDPHGVTGALEALRGLGRHDGYRRVARRMIQRGVLPPDGAEKEA